MSVLLTVDGRTTPLPAGFVPLAGGRTDETWTWDVLDRTTWARVAALSGRTDAGLTLDLTAATRGRGSLTWAGGLGAEPDWAQVLLRPTYSATLEDGSVLSQTMGVYRCSTGRRSYTGAHVSVAVSLYDRTLTLRRARTLTSYSVARGTGVIARVRSLLSTHAGPGPVAVEDSPATLRSDMTWDGGTPWATVIDDLLAAAGHTSLMADRDGVLRAGPHVPPFDRPSVWTFAPGAAAVTQPRWGRTVDDFDTPNRITLISRGDGDSEALTTTVTLDSLIPGHRLSHAVTGEWVDEVAEGVEAATQAVLDAEAARRLTDGIRAADTIDVEHMPLPIWVGDRATFTRPPVADEAVVASRISIECATGADWSTRLDVVDPATAAVDPAPTRPPADRPRHRWATVTGTAPLRVRLDGEPTELPTAPWGLLAGLTTGDRVWTQITGRQVVALVKQEEA